MPCLFAIPKPFRGQAGIIQRNAIWSWTLLKPSWEILLLGDEEGTAGLCLEWGLRHIPEVARNEFGTPLIDDLFRKAQDLSAEEVFCYVNADILLLKDFSEAAQALSAFHAPFLAAGQRRDLDVKDPIRFEEDWEKGLMDRAVREGRLRSPFCIDYFLFRRGLWKRIPPFAIGRTLWDNWLLYEARRSGAALVDLTPTVSAVHQDHDYSHVPGGEAAGLRGAETDRNRELAGDLRHIFSLHDATHVLTAGGIRPALDLQRLRRRFHAFYLFHPLLRPLLWPILAAGRTAGRIQRALPCPHPLPSPGGSP